MKRIIILSVIQIVFWGTLSAQGITGSSEYNFLFKKKSWSRLFFDSLKPEKTSYSFLFDSTFTSQNPFTDSRNKIPPRSDSSYFKKLSLKELNTTWNKSSYIDFKHTPPIRPLFYISLWNYSSITTLNRISHFYNTLEKDSRDLKHFWSGGVSHFKEIGYSGNYPGQQKPTYKIYIVRDGKRIKGFGIESLDDEW